MLPQSHPHSPVPMEPPNTAQSRRAHALLHSLLACLALLPISPGAADPAADPATELRSALPATAPFQIGRGAAPSSLLLSGLELALFSATIDGEDLLLRVGFRNATQETLQTFLPLAPSAFQLRRSSDGQIFSPSSLPHPLDTVLPREGLPPQLSAAGTLRFERAAPPAQPAPDAPPASFSLAVEGFATLPFSLEPARTLASPSWPALVDTIMPLQVELRSTLEALVLLSFHARSLAVEPAALRLDFAIENLSRFPLGASPAAIASAIRLIDAEGALLPQGELGGKLAALLDQNIDAWPPGTALEGSLRFPLPHPSAASELALLVAGYPPLRLRWDPPTARYLAAQQAIIPGQAPQLSEAMRDRVEQEQRFTQIQAALNGALADLAARRFDHFLRRFSPEARPQSHAIAFVNGFQATPISEIDVHLSPLQQFIPDGSGKLRSVALTLRYRLATIARDNAFFTQITCDLSPGPDGSWLISSWDLGQQPPFWTLGYTGILNSDRFLLFHRDDQEARQSARGVVDELEAAYAYLARRGLALEPRYVAILVAAKEDFTALTGRDPATFTGVASASYRVEDGHLVSANRAMYINDFRFGLLQRTWGGDRQTTVTHELVHLALAPYTTPATPPWLVEGIAMLFAGQTGRPNRDALARSPQLPNLSLAGLTSLPWIGAATTDATILQARYQLAGLAVDTLVDAYDEGRLLRFYTSFATPEQSRAQALQQALARGPEHRAQLAAQLLAEHYPGLTIEALDQLVRARLR